MVKQLIYFYLVFSFFGCGNSSDFENKTVQRNVEGIVESIRYWNDNNDDEEVIFFSSRGDTLSMYKKYGFSKGNAVFRGDTAFYKISLEYEDDNYFLNEYLAVLKDGSFLEEESEYVFMKKIGDSVQFELFAGGGAEFDLILYDKNDSTLQNGDTIKNNMVESHSLESKKALIFLRKSKGDDVVGRRIFLDFRLKKAHEAFFKLEKYGFPTE